VLVVDDERKIRDLVTLYLERDGYQSSRPPTGRRRWRLRSRAMWTSSSST
jgi:DNA-binding response OmpR family regulator